MSGEFDIVTKDSTDINGVQIVINKGQRGLVFFNTHATIYSRTAAARSDEVLIM